MQTRTQLLWELGVVMLVLAEVARQFIEKLAWLPPTFLFIAIGLILISWTYQYWYVSHSIRIIHSEVAVDIDDKHHEIIVFLTFLSIKDTSLDRIIRLDLSKKITKGTKGIIEFNPYFWLGIERNERFLFLESGKSEKVNDRRTLLFHTKNNSKIEKAITILKQGLKDGKYSIRYKTIDGKSYICKGHKLESLVK